MHHAWQITDIRILIFDYLQPQDLARLAQTSKTLFGATIPCLWSTLTSLEPIICCLPSDCSRRPVNAEDVQRLDLYASIVRNIVLDSGDPRVTLRVPKTFKSRLSQETKQYSCKQSKREKTMAINTGKTWEDLWEEIARVRPSFEFLPNLRSLRLNNAAEALLVPLVGISGCKLQKLYIRSVHEEKKGTVKQILEGFQDTPRLEYLFVRDGADVVPSKLLDQSPLKHLRLDPRMHSRGFVINFQFKKITLRYDILRKSTVQHLTIGLTNQWCTPELFAEKGKHLPALKTLWLNLTTFVPSSCVETCVNSRPGSWTCEQQRSQSPSDTTDCGRRPPTLFFETLDQPELRSLNIRFNHHVSGTQLIEVVNAAKSNCKLEQLTELALAGSGGFDKCSECNKLPAPCITSGQLQHAVQSLLPLPRLSFLRISIAPTFLATFDLKTYQEMADGLQSLEKLWLGYHEFGLSNIYRNYGKVPLRHIAAFCRLLPNLEEVSLGSVEALAGEEVPCEAWMCPSIKVLKVGCWARSEHTVEGVARHMLLRCLRAYFPASDFAKSEL